MEKNIARGSRRAAGFVMAPAKTPESVFFPSNLSPSVRRTISDCLEFDLELSH
jgi:hypothetical protein